MAQLGALAFRRRGIRAHALAATEALLDHDAYAGACVIAVSQSGRSTDLLNAINILKPKNLVALTNTSGAPLCELANVCIDIGAGAEVAVPASKSVSATAAILLWAAGLLSDKTTRSASSLIETARDVRYWLDGPGVDEVRAAAVDIARCRSVVIVASDYGVPIANEFALKLKEASYIHAEGFAAGEFRHGSAAMLDSSCAIIGIVDSASRVIVARPMTGAVKAGSLRYVIGEPLEDIPLLGPSVAESFNALAWLVAAQVVSLQVGRARFVDSDAPRGLSKFLT